MKSKKALIIVIALLVILLAAAAILYASLSNRHPAASDVGAGRLMDESPEKEEESDSVEPDEAGPDAPVPDTADAEKAEDFTVYDLDGNEVSLSDMAGKPVIVNFWASWCGPCRMELPHFEEAYREHGEDICFMMVDLTDGVDETREKVLELLDAEGYTFPVYLDSDFSATLAYGIYSIPETLAINTEGEIVATRVGSLSGAELDSLISLILE